MLETMYKRMNDWLFLDECPCYVISVKEVLDFAKQDRMEASHD